MMKKPNHPILIVEDEDTSLARLQLILEAAHFGNIAVVRDGDSVLPTIRSTRISLLLLDLNLPGVPGIELLQTINREFPEIPVIVITAENSIDTAIECMKRGAYDYIVKFGDNNRIYNSIRHALQMRELSEEVNSLSRRMLERELEHPDAFDPIITRNPEMEAIFSYVEAVAPSSKPILITGESGTGKELVARAIHQVSGRTGRFIPVNIAGLDDTMFMDTLFGHRRGAFTGAERERKGLIESAAGGTLFLDEIGELADQAQVRLLRLLQEREYYPLGSDDPAYSDARIVAATNVNLSEAIERGGLRKDLYYRLIGYHIRIPALRDRLEDIPLLLRHFLEDAAGSLGRKTPTVPPELETLLRTYQYPGNIRELQAMIHEGVSRSRTGILSLSTFKEYIARYREGQAPPELSRSESEITISYSGSFPTLKEVEEYLVKEAMFVSNGNQTIAADLLGLSQSTLSRRMARDRSG